MRRLPPDIRKELDSTGLDYTIRPAGRHYHLRLEGKLVGVMGYKDTSDRRAILNVRAQIRRAVKEMT